MTELAQTEKQRTGDVAKKVKKIQLIDSNKNRQFLFDREIENSVIAVFTFRSRLINN